MEDEKPNLPKLLPKAELRPKKKKPYKKKVYTQEETLRNFNKNYNTSLCFDDKTIDLTAIPPNWCEFVTRDISRIKFEECIKLLMTVPYNKLRDFMPQMPNLKYLGLIMCDIGTLYLRWHAFRTVEILDLTGNDIHKAKSLLGVKHLPNLNTLIIAGNPICYDKQEREELINSLNNISIQFN